MNKDHIMDALGFIDEAIIQKVADSRMPRKKPLHFPRWLAAAACLVLILSVSLSAEAAYGSVSNLLAPLFGGAQTQIVDEIGVPIGASASVNGYTLTVDAIIGDRYSVMIAYTLSRDDGQPIPEGIDFQKEEIRASGYRTPIEIDRDDPSTAHFHERWHRNEPLLGRIVTPSYSTLVIDGGEKEDTIVAEGTWEITFALRYPDTSEELPVQDLYVYDETGKQYCVKRMILSPLGIHMDVIEYDPVFAEVSFVTFQAALQLKDGTQIPLEGGGGGKMSSGETTRRFSYYGEFDIPIPREDILAFDICGTTYELEEIK